MGRGWNKSWHSQNLSIWRFHFISVQLGRSSAVQPQTNEANDWFFFRLRRTSICAHQFLYLLSFLFSQWRVRRNTLWALSVPHSTLSPHPFISAVVNASREHGVLFRCVCQTQQGYVACDAGELSIFPPVAGHTTQTSGPCWLKYVSRRAVRRLPLAPAAQYLHFIAAPNCKSTRS